MFYLYLFVGILILVSAFYLGLTNLELGVLVLIALLPLTHKETLSILVWDITPPRVFLVGLSLGAFLGALRNLWEERRSVKSWLVGLTQDKFFLLLLGLWLVRALSITRSLSLKDSLHLLAFFTGVLAFYLVFRGGYRRMGEGFLRKAEAVFLFVGFFLAFLALAQLFLYLSRGYVFLGIWPVEGWLPCLGATFWDINHFAIFTAALSLLFFGRFVSSSRGSALFNFLAFLLFLIVLGLTSSLSGLGMFAGGLLVMSALLLVGGYARRVLSVFVPGLLLVVLVFSFLAARGLNLRELYKINLSPRNDSVAAHIYLARGAWEIFRGHPWLGGGYGSFNGYFRHTSLIGEYLVRDPIGNHRIPVHSIWLGALSETGILGFLLLASILLFPVVQGIRGIWQLSDRRIYARNATLLGIVCGLFVSGLAYSYNILFFWFLIFLSLFYLRHAFSEVGSGNFWQFLKSRLYRKRELVAVIFLVVLSSAFVFVGLGRNALVPWDEAIYAGVSKEMVRSGDFLTPHWNGETFFEKPPLFFWLQSVSFFYLDFTAFAARIWPALLGIVGIIFTYLLGKKLFSRRVAFFAAVVLATTVHWIAWSRMAMLDVPAATLILVSLYFFWRAFSERRLFFWCLFGVFLGCVFMMKGPVAIIPIAVALLLSFIALVLQPSNFRDWYPLRALLLASASFLLIAFPWHYLMYARYGQSFLKEYLFYHILRRASHGIEQHGRPFWWFNLVIRHWARHWYLLGVLGFLTLAASLVKHLKRISAYRAEAFVFTWALLTFLIFSFSSSKIQWYILPIYPPLALICGWFVDRLLVFVLDRLMLLSESQGRLLPSLAAAGLVLLGVLGLFVYHRMWFPENLERQVAYLANRSRKLSDVGWKLYVADTPPPVPIFYSDKKVVTVDFEGARTASTSRGAVVLSKQGTYRKIIKKLTPAEKGRIVVFDQTEDYILFGSR